MFELLDALEGLEFFLEILVAIGRGFRALGRGVAFVFGRRRSLPSAVTPTMKSYGGQKRP